MASRFLKSHGEQGIVDPGNKQPGSRTEHGFARTICPCELCRAPCRHVPGALDPADLLRLCPEGQLPDVFIWAEEHLRALTNHPYPTLVPARQSDGTCHWLFQGQCAVHENAPYGCAFFDAHQSDEEVDRRYAATVQARREDARNGGLYWQVWSYLCRRGLVGRPGDRTSLAREVQQLVLVAERKQKAT